MRGSDRGRARPGDHVIEIEEIKLAVLKADILLAPYHQLQKDAELLALLTEELGCAKAARLLEPEMAARLDAGEEAGALPPPPPPEDGSSPEDAEEAVDEFHRGERSRGGVCHLDTPYYVSLMFLHTKCNEGRLSGGLARGQASSSRGGCGSAASRCCCGTAAAARRPAALARSAGACAASRRRSARRCWWA